MPHIMWAYLQQLSVQIWVAPNKKHILQNTVFFLLETVKAFNFPLKGFQNFIFLGTLCQGQIHRKVKMGFMFRWEFVYIVILLLSRRSNSRSTTGFGKILSFQATEFGASSRTIVLGFLFSFVFVDV